MSKPVPSINEWLAEAKNDPNSAKCGMYLVHNGQVRESAKAKVRAGASDTKPVIGMNFTYDQAKVDEAVNETYKLEGIYFIRVWINEGILNVGDDIMYVLIGGDIRPHVIDALQSLVSTIKNECVSEIEMY